MTMAYLENTKKAGTKQRRNAVKKPVISSDKRWLTPIRMESWIGL